MYLKSLELTGFKSFAKKTELTFNTPITGIVGPNGSGKSNTAEAFRFVLGEQSIKSMRGKRTEDLIWNGSPEVGRSNRASVKLTFDNRKKLLNLDFEEVTLERVIHRDSSSEYFLNGTQVRLRDIIELLAGAHIGASGHHIISQGEADRILNANLKERREMIEDALGLRIYQYKREESEKKLEKTEENMKQVEGLRKEIIPHLSFLKKQVEKIEKAKALKDELKALYAEYLKREHLYSALGKQKIADEARAPKRELERLSREIEEAKRVLSENKSRDGKTSAVIALESKLQQFRRDRDTLSRDLGRLEGEISASERLLMERKNVLAGETKVVPFVEVEKAVRQIEAEIVSAENGDEGLFRQAVQKIKSLLTGLIEKYRAVPDQSIAGAERELETLRAKKKEIEAKLSELSQKEREVAGEERKLREDIEKEKDSSRDAEKAVFRIMARQNELSGLLRALEAKRHEFEHLEGDFKHEIQEGIALIGRDILEYEKYEVKNEQGGVVIPEQVILEDRLRQEERRKKIERLKIRIEDSGALGADEVLKEFTEVSEREQFLLREIGDLETSAVSLKGLIKDLEEKLNEEFRNGIAKINDEFQKFFALMFGGGTAKLYVARPPVRRKGAEDTELSGLSDEAQVALAEVSEIEEGIDIEVNIPRKKIKALMMLSGGERALTSIALLFAMSQVKPPPFIILDETDAALDEANSRKYGDMVENLSKHSQLILITHNRETMSRAGVIYGVTMDRSGVSKLLSIAFEEALAVAK